MNEETISKPRLAYLIQVAEAAARDDESSASTRSEMRHVAAALRELEEHRVAREADTWPMCPADEARMERAAEALERRTAHRDQLVMALRECSDRLERCIAHGGTDKEYAAQAVSGYRELLSKIDQS